MYEARIKKLIDDYRAKSMSVAGYFDVDDSKALKIASEVGRAVKRWRALGARLGIKGSEIDRMASAFEHRDLESAISQ